MEEVEAPQFPTAEQHQFFSQRGYGDILDSIQIFASRKIGLNHGKNYFGVEEDGARQFIAWCTDPIPTYEEWQRRRKTTITPLEKKANDHEFALSKLSTAVQDLQAEVRFLKGVIATNAMRK